MSHLWWWLTLWVPLGAAAGVGLWLVAVTVGPVVQRWVDRWFR